MSQEKQLRVARQEWAYWKALGCLAVFWYQIRDAVGESFGLKMLDDRWRQVLALPTGV